MTIRTFAEPRARQRLIDVAGLVIISLSIADFLRPSLLFLPTITAGGDTQCHYPTFVWFFERLLPSLRLHGWYPGAYAGQPILLYYFPLPFLLMSALAPLFGLPVAFKLGTAGGVYLLPLFCYFSFRLMGFRFPGPLLAAAAALSFLFLEENPIWGGTLASTLTGEFSYTYGIGLGVLFLGIVYRSYAKGLRPFGPAVALSITALAHGYAVLWAGLAATFFLYGARKPLRTLKWLAIVAVLSFALGGVSLVPLLAAWGFTTPYDDPWITVTTKSLVPHYLWPILAVAAIGLLLTLLLARRTGGADRRVLFLFHAAVVGAALATAGPAMGVIDVRFVPFAQLSLCLVAAASLSQAVSLLAAPEAAALGLVIASALYGGGQSRFLRYWVEWNYTGLEAKELWPAFSDLTRRLQGSVSDPRVAVEYSPEHEQAGSIRMYETLPFFTGRSTLEGVYNQASLQTHFVYYLASELGASSPNPFKSREYSTFDTEGALSHLRLFDVSDVVALSDKLTTSLKAREDVEFLGSIPPYKLFHLKGKNPSYVEPLAYAPLRLPMKGWRDRSYRWFTTKPLPRTFLVFTDDPRFPPLGPDRLDPTADVPLDDGCVVHETVEAERIVVDTNRIGHPLLVKISYHPKWKAEGADGPFLVSPALMMIVPTRAHVVLTYGRDWADLAGLGLTLSGAAFGALAFARVRRESKAGVPLDLCSTSPPTPRWGGVLPAALLLALVASRFAASSHLFGVDPVQLSNEASRHYAAGRYDLARTAAARALGAGVPDELRAELLCLEGESLLKLAQPGDAARAFEGVVTMKSPGAHLAHALSGAVRARRQVGDASTADLWQKRLLGEFGNTPWAQGLEETETAGRP